MRGKESKLTINEIRNNKRDFECSRFWDEAGCRSNCPAFLRGECSDKVEMERRLKARA